MGHPDHATVEVAKLSPELATLLRRCRDDPHLVLSTLLEDRSTAAGQLCATAWTFDIDGRWVLLVEHPVLGWSVPGGHVAAGESPRACAMRELGEETGLAATSAGHVPLFVHRSESPTSGRGPAHGHWSVGYAMLADRGAVLHGEPGRAVAWWPCDDLPGARVADLDGLIPLARAGALRLQTGRRRVISRRLGGPSP
jgi:ADP-ribose pyrophosphatase YjhB (NUDIX family)